ncbi:hypothetical protein N5T80_02575 [Aliarcobacter cryaerophilus]|uniref:immunoglobulin-like domain-containing protein n=1 Tax=Aliarcobacter cryaerophilus TaxID=28198 RepID=UPI0021B543DF|nr:immunoglobulin-like domain-containing protein [Aliarcobacter cryaerophilus]MCT7545198.1 hypothetical protein [Aliarcobacter cryaerophilus]
MANLAQIQSIAQGQFFVKDSLGNLTELKVGDTVSLNDTIVAASSNTDLSKIEILFDTNELITLSQGEQLLDTTLLASTFGNEELAFDKQEVDETLNAWNNAQDGDATDMETAAGDVTEQATNAGNEEAADGGALRSKFNSRDGASTDVRSDLRDTSFGGGNTENPEEQIPTELLNPVGTTTPTTPTIPVPPASIPEITTPFISTVTLTSVGSGDEDGATVTYTATFTTAPTKDETVSFKVNGVDYSITVKAGDLIGTTTTLPYEDRDVVVDPTEIPVATDLATTNNSNYDDLQTVNNSTKFDVADSIDITKINVTAENSIDGKNIIINVSLTNKDGLDTKVTNVPLVITLNDGTKIIIPVGQTEGSTTITNPKPNGGIVEYSITSATGGNYESLDTTSTSTIVTKDIVPPVISIVGSTVTEANTGEVTGNKVLGEVTISFDKPLTEKLTVTLSNNQKVEFEAGNTSKTVKVETSRIDDAYKQGTTNETISIKSTSNPEIFIENKTATITIQDDIDPVNMTITATVTTPKIIDVNTKLDGSTGVKMYADSEYGKADISVIKGTNHDGFGVLTTDKNGKSINKSNGDTRELGLGEKIVVEFTDGKDVNSLDVAFAWRHNGEVAKVTFKNDGQVVGYAEVKGGGSNTLARVDYYDKDGNLIKSVQAQGGTDKVDLSYTFELPDTNGNLISFDKVEFSAPNREDDYLIHSIAYKEVVNPDITDIETSSGQVTFDIQIDEKYPPQGKATAVVELNGKIYNVALNATGRGTLTIDAKDLGDDLSKVKVKVLEVKGGNYEKVNSAEKDFDFTPTVEKPTSSNDKIVISEDTPYTLKIDDFGDNLSANTREFKITELPENGTLYLIVTKGETYFDKEGNKHTATEDTKVPVEKGQIISLADVASGKVEFVPNENSDEDGSFKFQVGDGNGNFSGNYTTDIIVKAVADAPIVSIDVTKIGATTNPSIEPTQKIGTTDSIKNIGTNGDDIIEVNKELVMNDKIDLKDGNDTLILNKNINQVTIDLGTGNDKVVINGQVNGTNNINLGSGDDVIKINNVVTNNTHINGGDGKDTLYLSGNKSDYIFNWQTNNNGMIEGSITDKKGGGIIQYNQMETIVFADGSYIGQKPQEEAPAQTIFKVDISAALTDTDGSETLSVVIKNVPTGAVLESTKYDVSKNSDGSWSVNFKEGTTGDALLKIEDSLTMKVPESYKGEINLEIEAKATEANDNEDGKNFKIATDSDAVVITTDETSVLTVSNEATNIVLTLDVTTSMVYNDYREGNHTSLHVLQKSAISTIEAYSSKGETNVNMTIFSKTAHNLGWMTSSEAIDYLKKLTQDENGNELRHWELNEKLETKLGITDVSTTNYKNAIAETVKVDFSGKSGNNVGYFISDGRPWDDASHTTEEYYSIGEKYQDQASWNNWKKFIKDNKIDLKVIGIGMPEDNKKAESFLQDIQAVMGHKDIILIDEPTSMETIFLSTVKGTVSGDVSDNIFGGDGKVTIDSIVVGDTTYNKADYPYGLITDKLGGKLTFDFETGKYAYNGNGIDIKEDATKSFKVNVSDEDGDKGSLDVNFELKAQPITDGLVKFEKGGDINFSNLENIVNLKEINLDNGKENKLSLTLDDVLKLSGDDGKIKITGDQFDSVAFKNTIGENGQAQTWSKAENSIVEDGKTFEVYTNSGDESLKVKVEQPISDGITN